MYGRSATQDRSQLQASPQGTFKNQTAAATRASQSSLGGAAAFFPIGLVILLALYFLWALVEQHERLRTAVRPQNVGINLRNIAVIMLTVILGLNFSKILTAKAVAWGIPGAKWGQMLVGGA